MWPTPGQNVLSPPTIPHSDPLDCLTSSHLEQTIENMMTPGQIDEVTKDDAQGVRQDREGGGSVMSQGTLRSVQFEKWPGKNGSG